MFDYVITTRPLQAREAVRLSVALRETPNILGYLPQELLRFPDALVVTKQPENGFAGVCLTKKLPQNWVDIAVIYVFPEYRTHGIGTALFQRALRDLRAQQKRVLCVSREDSVLRLMREEKMRFIHSWQIPFLLQMAYSRHYLSLYRLGEAIRKQAVYPSQPLFRYAVTER
jgi:GNAT superfamily N-acetyltransferase